jgi:hypothetical protein
VPVQRACRESSREVISTETKHCAKSRESEGGGGGRDSTVARVPGPDSTMRAPYTWPTLEHCILLVIAVVPVTPRGEECPDNVRDSTTSCLTTYNNHFYQLTQSGQTLYSGVDVELIRQLCQAFKESAICAHTIQKNCPETEHSKIETVAADLINVADLCAQTNLIEVYARYQNCYRNVQPSSQKCYEMYSAESNPLMSKVQSGDQQALISMCGYFTNLVTCIQSHVRPNCHSEEATRLVEYLVKPSIKMSDHCRNDTLHTTQSHTTTRYPSRESQATNWAQVNGVGAQSHLTTLCLIGCMMATLRNIM